MGDEPRPVAGTTPTPGPGSGDALDVVWCGRERFAPCLERQLAAREALVRGEGPPTLFLVEHPPVLTLGRRGARSDILWPDEALADRGIEVCESPRGGEVTLHAPGQLVAYPVVYVGKRIRAHIVRLADTARALLAEVGVPGTEFRMEHPGVWLGRRKLASIGIHVSRGVAVQGISINLGVDPDLFSALVSCGTPDIRMTSAADLGAEPPPMREAADRFAALWRASATP